MKQRHRRKIFQSRLQNRKADLWEYTKDVLLNKRPLNPLFIKIYGKFASKKAASEYIKLISGKINLIQLR